eukprot:SM000203S06148  [mRNA]  locus=s203:137377:139309:+ [translate_table: standard]
MMSAVWSVFLTGLRAAEVTTITATLPSLTRSPAAPQLAHAESLARSAEGLCLALAGWDFETGGGVLVVVVASLVGMLACDGHLLRPPVASRGWSHCLERSRVLSKIVPLGHVTRIASTPLTQTQKDWQVASSNAVAKPEVCNATIPSIKSSGCTWQAGLQHPVPNHYNVVIRSWRQAPRPRCKLQRQAVPDCWHLLEAGAGDLKGRWELGKADLEMEGGAWVAEEMVGPATVTEAAAPAAGATAAEARERKLVLAKAEGRLDSEGGAAAGEVV